MTACPTCGRIAPVVLRSWETWIDAKVESANMRSVNAGTSRWGYAKKRDEWIMRWRAAGWLTDDLRGFATFAIKADGHRRHVTFTRRYAGREREMDHANLVGGMKGVVDAMVRVGLLVDDSPKWFEAEYVQVRSDRSGLHVRIEERAE